MADALAVLGHLVVVLACAAAAGRLAERLRVPAVAGEIVAGLLIGPSLLGLVGADHVLRTLGQLGVVLLLLDVGLQTPRRELTTVGRASLAVAVVGMVVPFAGGYGVARVAGLGGHVPLLLGAALTATSVGVTARVFADLRVLGTVEARTVLGAAVADDVLGLVVLAVVVGVVSTEPLGVAGVLARTPMLVAFVAGVCAAGTRRANALRRRLSPANRVLVPVFFVQAGIDVDVRAFAHPRAVGLALALLAVAVLGKVVSGTAGSRGDRLLIGLGMVPRGEVGLVFATVGLRAGVLDADTYGALLLVVLLSTVVTPPLLRWRLDTHELGTRRKHPGHRWETAAS